MLQAVTTEQMREIDRLMVEEFGVSLMHMTGMAGLHTASVARDFMSGTVREKTVAVFVGKGHNGTGGFAAARNLVNWGAKVLVYTSVSKEEMGQESQQYWYMLEKAGVVPIVVTDEVAFETKQADIFIDALLGYGIEGNPRGNVARMIEHINKSGHKVIALDVPSGLDSTTGVIYAPCVLAKATVSLALPKAGLSKPEAKRVVGDLFLADIGVPQTLYKQLGLEVGNIFAQDDILEVKIKVVKVKEEATG